VQAFGYEIDVSEPASVIKCANQVKRDVGDVTIVINNAGYLHRTEPFLNLSPMEIEKTFNVNTLSQCWILRQFLPQMVAKNSGHIVTINSAAGQAGCNNFSVYSASNFANRGLIQSLKLEMRRDNVNNINFTTVHPGFMNTNMVSNKNICFRYPSFQTRILEPEEAAMEIVDAVRRNEEYVFVPKSSSLFLTLLSNLLPSKAEAVINDVFGVQSVNIS
jgi:all-trans-retinol dehydrogenase (NAD+)